MPALQHGDRITTDFQLWQVLLKVANKSMLSYDIRGVYRVLVEKPERKRPLGRPRRRWEDNIKMDIHEVG